MIKTPLSTVIGGAFWTPGATILGSSSKNLSQLIESLFSLGEQGFAYDPNDLTTMWQDAAKLLPVTGEGQPVWHILDKSGNNNHAFATSSATRPILQRNATTGAYYLAFDGADDFLQTNNINFTATDEITVIAAVKNTSTVGYQNIVEFSVNSSINNGTFLLRCPHELKPFYLSRGTVVAQTALITTLNLLDGVVLSAKSKISTDNLTLRVNGVSNVINTDQGAGNYGNYPLYIGRRGGTLQPFIGHLYGLIGIGRLTTDSETIALEKSIAKNVGVTLNV